MTAHYILSREAGRDLEEIEDYTARNWGDAQAEKYIRDIFHAFEKLTKNPRLGHRREDIPSPYLVYAVDGHLVVYRCRKSRVEVLNVLHPAMNIAARLQEALRRAAKPRS